MYVNWLFANHFYPQINIFIKQYIHEALLKGGELSIDTINYIELLEECNRNRKKMEFPKSEYKTIYGENIKGIMFRNQFYSVSKYEEISNQKIDI